MSKASDRRAFIKLREAFEKDVLKHLKVMIKGSGWRKSGNDLVKSVDGLFFNVDMRSHLDARKPEFWFRAKPMAIDEIFWDVMQIPENRDQPLSFRGSAWFKCPVPQANNLVVDDETQDALNLAQTLLQYANEHAANTRQRCFVCIALREKPTKPVCLQRITYPGNANAAVALALLFRIFLSWLWCIWEQPNQRQN